MHSSQAYNCGRAVTLASNGALPAAASLAHGIAGRELQRLHAYAELAAEAFEFAGQQTADAHAV